MKYIRDLKEGDRVFDIYLCKHKQAAVTKNGKPYENVILQDKTGTIDAKVWEPNNPGIGDYDSLDYIEVYGDVNHFQGALQINVKRIRVCKEGEYNPADYLPVSSRDIDGMYRELLELIESIGNPYLKALLEAFFTKDEAFAKAFRRSSAAKTVHHGFVGGLLEHTLGVTKLCDYYCSAYPVLNRDLLLTAAMCHDIGKTREISPFPENDYTDDGQLLGHIVMGSQMVAEAAAKIDGFPHGLLTEIQHCILAHHGKYEYGSPKIPALIEALALNYADDTDAKLETFKEILENGRGNQGWLGYNRLFESNLRATRCKTRAESAVKPENKMQPEKSAEELM
ncbi:MAG: HD domain-containing protein [bacterium]|nr:HD domain-containing protein [bacterium]